MRADRRTMLGALAGGLVARPLRATTIQPTAWGNFALEIEPASRLTQGGWMRGRLARLSPVGTLSCDDTAIALDADGRFFVGFDRDAPSVVHLRGACGGTGSCTADGAAPEFGLAIAPRAWAIQRVDVARRPPGLPDAEFERRRAGELALIKAARATRTGAEGWRQAMLRPAPGRTSGHFGAQRIYRGEPGAYHSGMDIAGGAGTPFVSPADGRVVLAAADAFTLEGHLLIIDHGMGLNSAFLHASALDVGEGDAVRRGQPVGRIGMTGRATGPHLHWSITWQGRRMDPELLLAQQ